jgi:hypothetical protein
MAKEQRDPLVAQAHSLVEQCASDHDEEDQAVVYDETIDSSMLTRSVTSTNDEGATPCPT